MTASEGARQRRAAIRRHARATALGLIKSSGGGTAAGALAVRLPQREPIDRPRSLLMGPFTGKRLAILAHYSQDGGLDRGFVHLGQSLAGLGFGVLVVSTATASLELLAEESESFAFGAVVRGNEGFDFQSWRRGLELARENGLNFDRLILTNGSMFGPLGPIEHVLSRMDRHGTWGMTESMDFRRHIQSWWLGFGREVLTHPEFDRYWARVRPATNKWETILAHELRWADDLSLAGPAVPYVRVEDHGCTRNPLFFAWRELIRDWQMPFVKRSLFGPNYDRIDMTGWQSFLAEYCPSFDQSLIGA